MNFYVIDIHIKLYIYIYINFNTVYMYHLKIHKYVNFGICIEKVLRP